MPIFMKVEGVDGPVTGKYKGWIKLKDEDVNEGVIFQGARKGLPPIPDFQVSQKGRRLPPSAALNEMFINKDRDRSTMLLLQLFIRGEARTVTLDFVNTDKLHTAYQRIVLEGAVITSYVIGGADEELMLKFTKQTIVPTVNTSLLAVQIGLLLPAVQGIR